MSVDWVRSCFSSNWRLFRDSLSTLVAGRFYFSPPNTPFYPGFHNLGSKKWYDTNNPIVQGLGEDLSTQQSYDTGNLPAIAVGTLPVGLSDCIANGESINNAVSGQSLVNGFITQCVNQPILDLIKWQGLSDFNSCSVQLAGARILLWMYDFDTVALFDFLEGFLGPGYTCRFHRGTTLLPSVTTAVSTAGTLCWVDGTANFQQFALQAAYSLIGPTDQGAFSTSSFWSTAARHVIDTLAADGYDGSTPLFVCGHSYGGVTALIVAAQVMYANNDRTVRFLTYGCPHVGDRRFTSLLRMCIGLNLRNDSDIVTAIPTDLEPIQVVATALGFPSLLSWLAWKKAPFGSMMDADGNLTVDAEPLLDYPTLLGFCSDVIASLPYPVIQAHKTQEYYDRILNRCDSAEWPLTDSDFAKLLAKQNILMNDGSAMLMNDGSSMLMND